MRVSVALCRRALYSRGAFPEGLEAGTTTTPNVRKRWPVSYRFPLFLRDTVVEGCRLRHRKTACRESEPENRRLTSVRVRTPGVGSGGVGYPSVYPHLVASARRRPADALQAVWLYLTAQNIARPAQNRGSSPHDTPIHRRTRDRRFNETAAEGGMAAQLTLPSMNPTTMKPTFP